MCVKTKKMFYRILFIDVLKSMEKENGESSIADALGGNGNSSKGDTSLLDAASLFGGNLIFFKVHSV